MLTINNLATKVSCLEKSIKPFYKTGALYQEAMARKYGSPRLNVKKNLLLVFLYWIKKCK
jgi:hypothetical protein